MTITYQSVQSNTSDNVGTLTITKPTSLAVGNYMLAGIFVDRDAGTSASISTPAGWTQLSLLDLEANGNCAIGVYGKVADSSDVAAANFTFTGTGSTGSMSMSGHILRITDFGGSAGLTSAVDTSASTTLTMTGITPSPAIASSLYVVFAGRVFSTAVTVNSVAIATSNPTWTERAENAVNGSSRDTQFAVYTATRTETTATGNYTVTYASTNNIGSGAVGIILHDPINGSITPTTQINAYAFSPISTTQINAVVEDPGVASRNVTVWTNETITPTTWTNEQL